MYMLTLRVFLDVLHTYKHAVLYFYRFFMRGSEAIWATWGCRTIWMTNSWWCPQETWKVLSSHEHVHVSVNLHHLYVSLLLLMISYTGAMFYSEAYMCFIIYRHDTYIAYHSNNNNMSVLHGSGECDMHQVWMIDMIQKYRGQPCTEPANTLPAYVDNLPEPYLIYIQLKLIYWGKWFDSWTSPRIHEKLECHKLPSFSTLGDQLLSHSLGLSWSMDRMVRVCGLWTTSRRGLGSSLSRGRGLPSTLSSRAGTGLGQ